MASTWKVWNWHIILSTLYIYLWFHRSVCTDNFLFIYIYRFFPFISVYPTSYPLYYVRVSNGKLLCWLLDCYANKYEYNEEYDMIYSFINTYVIAAFDLSYVGSDTWHVFIDLLFWREFLFCFVNFKVKKWREITRIFSFEKNWFWWVLN